MPIIGSIGSQNTKSFLNPNAPTIGTATNAGSGRAYNNGSATVTFTAAATGASATSFTVTSSPASYSATGASSPLTVTGLQSDTSYTFIVRATNAVGDSSNSAASNSIIATTVPQAPTIGTATASGTTASVPFTAGANGGAAVSTFTATSYPGSFTGTSATSPITVSGLIGGTAYTFTVTGTNANGTSTASSASNSLSIFEPIGAYDSIATTTVGSGGASSVTFSGILSTYQHLQIRCFARSDRSGEPTSQLYIRLNGDSGSNYSNHKLVGVANGYAGGEAGVNSTIMTTSDSITGPTSTSGIFGATVIDFLDYADTNKYKTLCTLGGMDINQSGGGNGYINLASGNWRNTAAITSIQLFPIGNFVEYSSIALYGIKGA